MEYIRVKPVEGRRCKDPRDRQLLPERGRNVPKNSYWLKRLRSGDCVLMDSPSKVKEIIDEPIQSTEAE